MEYERDSTSSYNIVGKECYIMFSGTTGMTGMTGPKECPTYIDYTGPTGPMRPKEYTVYIDYSGPTGTLSKIEE